MKHLNHTVLIPHLCETLQLNFESVDDGSESLLARLEQLGPSKMPGFLRSLNEEDQHLGHDYILSLLSGKDYATSHEISISSKIRERIHSQDIMAKIELGLNIRTALLSHLIKKKLLTDDESEMLQKSTTLEGNVTLLRLLDTKGPTAHLLFVRCLKEEVTHRTHQELFELICGGEDAIELPPSMSRKRKNSRDCHEISVTKRHPDRLRLDGKLDKDEYFDVIQKIRLHHLHGEWEAVDRIVDACSKKSTEFYVAVLLESCTGFITQLKVNKVEETVKEAKRLCCKITNNCYVYLMGRCEWTLAKSYRYSKQFRKALNCIKVARQIQYNVKAGEDTALANYCHGCILSEFIRIGEFDPDMVKEAERSFELAIAHASSGDYGLDLSHPKIRLSQLWLRYSLSHSSNSNTDPDGLRKAHAILESMDHKTLAPKTRCMYFYTKSDLYKTTGETQRAITSARTALNVAKTNKLITEIEQAQKRIIKLTK